MEDLDQFLREAVFYPCSGLDPIPIALLSEIGFSKYFYVDCMVDRRSFEEGCRANTLGGYRLDHIEDFDEELILRTSWLRLCEQYRYLTAQAHWDSQQGWLSVAHFKPNADLAQGDRPQSIHLMFARCEAITAYRAAYGNKKMKPSCFVSICPGNLGGNYSTYYDELNRALVGNAEGFPERVLFDRSAEHQLSELHATYTADVGRRMPEGLAFVVKKEPGTQSVSPLEPSIQPHTRPLHDAVYFDERFPNSRLFIWHKYTPLLVTLLNASAKEHFDLRKRAQLVGFRVGAPQPSDYICFSEIALTSKTTEFLQGLEKQGFHRLK